MFIQIGTAQGTGANKMIVIAGLEFAIEELCVRGVAFADAVAAIVQIDSNGGKTQVVVDEDNDEDVIIDVCPYWM